MTIAASPRISAWRTFATSCAVAASVVVSGCQQPAGEWNTVFHRSQGWQYADGGSSVELADGRRVWLFGDSMIRHEHGLVYNTIAISNAESGRAPAAEELRFFARAQGGGLLDVSRQGADGMRPWLEPSAERADGRKTWLWPTDVVTSGGALIAFYSEIGCVRGEFPACRSYLGNMGFLGHRVMVVENPSAEPESWKIRTVPLMDKRGKSPSEHHLHWGSALLEDGGWLYVFGTNLNEHDGPEDVKLARTVPGKADRYDLWQFLTPDGWRMFPAGASPADLVSLARGGATEFSVDRVVRGGAPWFVMLQVNPFSQEVVVRSAPASDVEAVRWDGPDMGPGVRRLSLPVLDPASAKGMTWSGRSLRRPSATNEGLLVSYFSSSTASLRFVDLPMSSLRAGW